MFRDDSMSANDSLVRASVMNTPANNTRDVKGAASRYVSARDDDASSATLLTASHAITAVGFAVLPHTKVVVAVGE